MNSPGNSVLVLHSSYTKLCKSLQFYIINIKLLYKYYTITIQFYTINIHILHKYYTITIQILDNYHTITIQSLYNYYTITKQLLYNYHKITLQLLYNYYTVLCNNCKITIQLISPLQAASTVFASLDTLRSGLVQYRV